MQEYQLVHITTTYLHSYSKRFIKQHSPLTKVYKKNFDYIAIHLNWAQPLSILVGKAATEGARKARPVGIATSEGPRKVRLVRNISNQRPTKSKTQRILFHLQKSI
jgi:hypothetical protein